MGNGKWEMGKWKMIILLLYIMDPDVETAMGLIEENIEHFRDDEYVSLMNSLQSLHRKVAALKHTVNGNGNGNGNGNNNAGISSNNKIIDNCMVKFFCFPILITRGHMRCPFYDNPIETARLLRNDYLLFTNILLHTRIIVYQIGTVKPTHFDLFLFPGNEIAEPAVIPMFDCLVRHGVYQRKKRLVNRFSRSFIGLCQFNRVSPRKILRHLRKISC